MNDCPNAEIRDLLPDLLHERLEGERRAVVLAHVDGCVDCREELELLRGVRGAMLSATRQVNVAAIVAQLPAPRPVRATPRRWASWQLAAAVTLLLAGGTSVLTLRNRAGLDSVTVATTESAAVAPTRAAVGVAPEAVTQPAAGSSAEARRPATARAARELALNSQLADLDEGELRTLLADIEGMDAVTAPEPETLGLNPPALTPEER